MTIDSANNKVIYTGTGAVSTYTFSFPVYNEDHLEVTEQVIATGVETAYVKTTDYTVTLNADNTGSITLVAGNLPATKKISIKRVVPLTQATDIRNRGAYFPEAHEDEFDLLVMADQQLDEDLDRSFKVGKTTDTTAFSTDIGVPVAGNYIRVKADGTGLEQVTTPSDSALTLTTDLKFMVQKPAGTFIGRTLTNGTDISITNGDGQAGDPTINCTLGADLASTANGDGASKIGVEDAAANFAGTTVEAVLAEIIADYAATTNGNGASKIGVEDSAGDFTATTVEGVLTEIQGNIDSSAVKYASGSFSSDNTNNRTISTGIAGGSTLIQVIVGQLANSTTSIWQHGAADHLQTGATSAARNANATDRFTTSGVDFIVGSSGTNVGSSNTCYWAVLYV